MSGIINIVKWVLMVVGAIAVYYGVSLQMKYDGVTVKIISEVVSPELHEESTKVYMDMANILLNTGDITEATIVKNKVTIKDEDLDLDDPSDNVKAECQEFVKDLEKNSQCIKLQSRIELIEETMSFAATELEIKEVGELPLSKQVKMQLGKDQRFLKIYQYCKPSTAMTMVEHSDAFSAYLPCRIALIEDKKHFETKGKEGDLWLYSLNMDMMIYGGYPLPGNLNELAIQVKNTITTIQKSGAAGEYEEQE
jgi:uncharacterized protein (DUF302 family)